MRLQDDDLVEILNNCRKGWPVETILNAFNAGMVNNAAGCLGHSRLPS